MRRRFDAKSSRSNNSQCRCCFAAGHLNHIHSCTCFCCDASRAQKRKHEPPDASQDVADASIARARRAMRRQPTTVQTAPAETESGDTARSHKRHRSNQTVDPALDDSIVDATKPRKRGRPSRAAPVVDDDVTPAAAAAAAAPKRRGRPSTKPTTATEPEPRPEPDPPPPHAKEPDDVPRGGKQRGRKKASAVTREEAEEADVSQEAGKAGAPYRRSKRSSQTSGANTSAPGPDNPAESLSAEAAGASKRKRGRPSLSSLAIQETQNQRPSSPGPQQGPKKKRGRPSLIGQQAREPPEAEVAEGSQTADPDAATAQDRQPTRGRQRRSEPEAAGNQEQSQGAAEADAEPESTARPRKKRPSTQAADAAEEEAGGHPGPTFDSKYQYIQECMQLVPRSKIAAKWGPLDAASIDAVRAMLLDAQRPVLYHLRDTQRRQEAASSILSAVCGRIQRKLGRGLPFPPPAFAAGGAGRGASASAGQLRSGHEIELDYERAVDAAQALEDQLNPSLHAVELLKAEIEKEERLLENDYKVLRQLETNARDEAREWKKNLRTSHVLVPDVQSCEPPTTGLFDEDRGLILAERQSGGLYKDLDDKELLGLSQQMNNHLDSMRGNLQQIGPLLPAITKSKAALHEVLLRHLDPGQCDAVLLG
ncbi:hypothetical protein RB598_009369 [Gaeumannomyces tritici]